ncbi:conjugal transfer protein TraG N-terminal domain-containing protein [Sphingomonas sp. BIUV-7]|uniref:Conjugal transfer protein TraG N-terminal domain-containing protein n=1 Tax=Sphingomonas natans TaxID=3063330 RepID=A0ABT8Y7V0_9SPHN|nr:conjugal transfer protein TraG N-terminal domain-containing protein [Sphingomonas sp. BIUV-7]MDO6414399.1 conjugal transfer protein TraG N-terminal domain-containing protein [Sphingomonas sp. BIUV-7]
MFEVITVGGGEYIVNVFNAVAAWTGGGGYKSMLQCVLVMAFAMSLMVVAFNHDWRAWLNWFLQATLMYMCLMVPRMDVQVIDRINPSLAASHVENVPLGLAAVAGFTSQIGDYLVRTSEVVFGMPDDLNYSKNGMIYGSRLMEATQGLSISDPYFASNVDEYYRQCTFYDLQLGLKNWTDIADADDVWAAVGPGSQARSMMFVSATSAGGSTSEIKSCRDGYNALTAGWDGVIDGMGSRISRRFYPGMTDAAAKAKLFADLPIAYNYLTGVSKDASHLMKQTLSINALQQSISTQVAAAGGSSTDVYAQTRASIQTRNTYQAVAHNAMEWVPILCVVLTVVFYALFPIIFPLFLMPGTGVGALRGYVTGFFYLAAWGPLYVILNMVVTLREHTQLASTAKLSMLSFNDMASINANTAVLAGYLVASIPFIAAGMARGAMAISGHATSFLAPSQNAAEEAGREAATGNIAFGNTSLENLSFNNRQSGAWSTAGHYGGGYATLGDTTRFGSTVTSYADGSSSVDVPMSKVPFGAQLTQAADYAVADVASSFQTQGQRATETARESTATMLQNFRNMENRVAHGTSDSLGVGSSELSALRTGFSARDSLSQTLQDKHGLSKVEADNYSSASLLGVEGSLGFSKSLLGANVGVGAKASQHWQWQDTLGKTRSVDTASLRDTASTWARDNHWDRSSDAFQRAATETTNSQLSSSASGISASRTKSTEASREAARYMDAGSRLEKSHSLRDSDGISTSVALQDRMRTWARAEMDAHHEIYGPASQRFDPDRRDDWTTSDPQISGQRERLIGRFIASYRDELRSEADAYIKAPAMDVQGPAVRSTAGVERAARGDLGQVGGAGVGAPIGQAARERAGHVFEQVEAAQASQTGGFDAANRIATTRRPGIEGQTDDVEAQVDRELAPRVPLSPLRDRPLNERR